LSGLLGVGGGFVMVPGQVLWTRTSQLKANATSLAAIIPISAVGVVVYYFAGVGRHHEADLRFAGIMTAGAVVGAYLGARLVGRLPERTLRMAVAVLFLVVGVKQLILPGG
jgi:uncharacterized protein